MSEKRFRNYIGWFIFAVALITVYKTIDSVGIVFSWLGDLLKVFAPFGFALLLAYLLYFPCRRIEKLIRKCNARGGTDNISVAYLVIERSKN